MFKSDEEFVNALHHDVHTITSLAIKYVKEFPDFSVLLSVISYIILSGDKGKLDELLVVCRTFTAEIRESINQITGKQIDSFLDSLNIDKEYFKPDTDTDTDQK